LKDLIVFIDSGDTLVDESTEIRDETGVVVEAELLPGAADALRRLRREGYRIALVADGLRASFDNVYRQHGLEDIFEVRAISEDLGARKPHPVMFGTAMERMGLTEQDKSRIVMVGNHLERDIAGANRMGLVSVLMSWTPRYPMQPRTPEEVPDFVLSCLTELPAFLEQLDRQVQNRRVLGPCTFEKKP